MSQKNLFGTDEEFNLSRLTNASMIKTVSYSQSEILSWIISLYCQDGFQLDVTYSKGAFYKLIPKPEIKMDLSPGPGIVCADVQAIPLKSASINSAVFDPPFLGASPVKVTPGSNIIASRFGQYRNFDELWAMYRVALEELYRVLSPGGHLIVKCQDGVNDHKQHFSHVELITYALCIGFYAIDLFILLSRAVLIGGNHQRQEHARKTHSYFLVFCKKGRSVNYWFLSNQQFNTDTKKRAG